MDKSQLQEGVKGFTLMDRLQELCQTIEKDIRRCANTCDACAKQSTTVKYMKALKWKSTLGDFIKLFETRQAELGKCFAVGTFAGVKAIEKRVERFVAAFSYDVYYGMIPSSRIAAYQAKFQAISIPESSGGSISDADTRAPMALETLAGQSNVALEPEDAVKRNSETFERKFNLQNHELLQTIQNSEKTLVAAVEGLEGSHRQVNDPVSVFEPGSTVHADTEYTIVDLAKHLEGNGLYPFSFHSSFYPYLACRLGSATLKQSISSRHSETISARNLIWTSTFLTPGH